MGDLSQTVLLFLYSVTSHAIVIKVQHISTVAAWINGKGNGVHLALGIQFSNVLLQFPDGNNRSLPDVNGAIVFGGVVPRSDKLDLRSSIDRAFKWHQVIIKSIPLASGGEVHGSTFLTCRENRLPLQQHF